ncbi:MAG: L,D-transpeptidase family protein [Methyloceanibacter sp.]
MSGRALGAAVGATALVLLLTVGTASAEAPLARAGTTDLAAVDLPEPAQSESDRLSPATLPATGDDVFATPADDGGELAASPAAAAEGEEGRDPADGLDAAAAPPGEAETPSAVAEPAASAAHQSAETAKPVEVDKPGEIATPAPSQTETESALADRAETPAESVAPDGEDAAIAAAPEPPPAHPIVAEIRLKLKVEALRKGAAADDLAALEAFYATHSGPPLWITTVGFNSKAQELIAEIQKAADWGLPAEAFDLPPASDLPSTTEAQAVDEIKLALAALKYARFARGGRVSPSRISKLFDQKSNLLDPKEVLRDVAASSDPGAYLVSLHPKHDQFERLRQHLAKALAEAKARGRKPAADGQVQRIVVNMERWRWMPLDLGRYHVWNNVPAFTTRVMKDGKSIYIEKAIVGQVKYATPIFSSEMRSIVFNPQWVVPETIKNEDLHPRLRQTVRGAADTSVLRENRLTVSFRGKPIDAATIDWTRANIHAYTFTQAPGPTNVLGTLKFNFPNRHAIYMHDTVQRELFKETVRTLSHGCIRLHQPDRLAALLLAEDKGWSADQVNAMLAKGNNSGVMLSRPVPVHLTYFTLAYDGIGRLQTYADVYSLDAKMAQALFGKSELHQIDNVTAPVPAPRQQRRSASSGVRGPYLPGLFGN